MPGGTTVRISHLVGWTSWRSTMVVFVALGLALAGAGPASTATRAVCPSGCAFPTVTAALAAAHDGDKIAIGAGTYSGGLTIDKSISLLGAGSGLVTIGGGGPVVRIGFGEA